MVDVRVDPEEALEDGFCHLHEVGRECASELLGEHLVVVNLRGRGGRREGGKGGRREVRLSSKLLGGLIHIFGKPRRVEEECGWLKAACNLCCCGKQSTGDGIQWATPWVLPGVAGCCQVLPGVAGFVRTLLPLFKPPHTIEFKFHTCSSIQSKRLFMYIGADSRKGFLILTPSAHRYSYCRGGGGRARKVNTGTGTVGEGGGRTGGRACERRIFAPTYHLVPPPPHTHTPWPPPT